MFFLFHAWTLQFHAKNNLLGYVHKVRSEHEISTRLKYQIGFDNTFELLAIPSEVFDHSRYSRLINTSSLKFSKNQIFLKVSPETREVSVISTRQKPSCYM